MPARKKPAPKGAPPTPTPAPEPPPLPDPAPAPVIEAKLEMVKCAGDVSLSMVERMKELLPPEEVAQKLRQMLYATRWIKSQRKDDDGDYIWMEVPDVRANEAAIKIYMAYTVGVPSQQAPPAPGTGTRDDMLDRAGQSRATGRQLERQAEDAARHAADLARQVEEMRARKTAEK